MQHHTPSSAGPRRRRPRWASAAALSLAAACLAAVLGAASASAQRKPPEPAKKEEPAAAEPKVEVEGRGAILQGLDKVTARVTVIEADIGKPVKFGSLEIVVRRCQRSRPDQKLERAAFLEIDHTDPGTANKKRIFTGWMFWSIPALSALEHPVYDVWVKDCK